MNRAAKPSTPGDSELQRAIDCGELIRLYQPIVELSDGSLRYVEALLRWDHRARGLLAPRDFLVDEDSELLVRIGWSVVIEAARRAGEWRRTYPDHPVTVSVNLSDVHLSARELPARVEHLLDDNEVPGPNALAFEISERHLLSNRRRSRDRLLPLRNVNVEIVVDDLGATAAGSRLGADELRDSMLELLEPLRAFPLDIVKLDPTFVRRLGSSIVDVVAAAHEAGLRVVAAAVEEQDDLAAAIDAGFDLAQGFVLHRPERPAYVDGLLASR